MNINGHTYGTASKLEKSHFVENTSGLRSYTQDFATLPETEIKQIKHQRQESHEYKADIFSASSNESVCCLSVLFEGGA